jgi:hypothetical protein
MIMSTSDDCDAGRRSHRVSHLAFFAASLLFGTCVVVAIAANGTPTSRAADQSESTRTDELHQSVSPSPGLNRAPEFVGKEVCRQCHAENYDLHANSGHASTFAVSSESDLAEKFDGKTLDVGDPYGAFQYSRDSRGLVARRLDDDDAEAFHLQYLLGSGRNAITPLTLVRDDDGSTAGVEHRVSWFGSHDGFGLTPGHAGKLPTTDLEFFGDLVHGKSLQECVRCHTTSGTIEGNGVVDLVANVNCERCHGPGSEHVRQARLSEPPPPYSVGHGGWDLESELQLCGSCHRLPRHISPRELRDYTPEMLRFQPVGMLRSECYLKSQGSFMCSTCHNPHADSKSKSKEAYVQDCRNCHSNESEAHVTCPVSTTEGCIECHMPPVTFEQGMVFHDHWIRVRDDQ